MPADKQRTESHYCKSCVHIDTFSYRSNICFYVKLKKKKKGKKEPGNYDVFLREKGWIINDFEVQNVPHVNISLHGQTGAHTERVTIFQPSGS